MAKPENFLGLCGQIDVNPTRGHVTKMPDTSFRGKRYLFFSVKKSVLFLYFVLVILDIAQMYFCSVKKVKVYLCIFCVFLLPAVPGEAA